ncbi:MAG: hypothetical protein ACRETL_17160 [Gammaproteobacteria bacterium]
MAKSTGRRLKVFQAQFGFYDSVVAAPSQAAALRAWGTHQNLFASGEAKVTTDEAAIAAATAHPDTPLRRAVGSPAPFALEPTSLPRMPDRQKAASKTAVKLALPAPARLPANRSELDVAEKALLALDERRQSEEGDLRRDKEELEARRQAAQSAYVRARKAATAMIAEARTTYRKAGGKD